MAKDKNVFQKAEAKAPVALVPSTTCGGYLQMCIGGETKLLNDPKKCKISGAYIDLGDLGDLGALGDTITNIQNLITINKDKIAELEAHEIDTIANPDADGFFDIILKDGTVLPTQLPVDVDTAPVTVVDINDADADGFYDVIMSDGTTVPTKIPVDVDEVPKGYHLHYKETTADGKALVFSVMNDKDDTQSDHDDVLVPIGDIAPDAVSYHLHFDKVDDTGIVFKVVNEDDSPSGHADVIVPLADLQAVDINVADFKYNKVTGRLLITETDGEEHEVFLPVCPGEMTQVEFNALKASNSLKAGCSYVVTDPDSHGNLDVIKMKYTASGTGTVDARVEVVTSHQPKQGWQGRLNFFNGKLVELADNLGNFVQGSTQVITFPWGNAKVHSNTLELDSTLSYTGGELVRTVVSRNSLLEMSKGSKVAEVNVLDGSTLRAKGTVVVQGSDIKNGSVCNMVASQFGKITLRTSVIESESAVNIENSLGLINNFSLSNKGTLTLKSVAKCAISKTAIDGANLTGTGTGNLNLSKTQIVAGSEVNVDGAGLALCLGVVIDNYAVVDITNGATVQMKYSNVSGATVRCEDVKVNLALTTSNVNTGAKLIVKDKTVFVGETTIAEHSTLTLTGGTGETRITRSNLSGYGVLAVSFNDKKVDIQGLIIESGQLDIKNGTGNYQLLWSRIAQAYLITADIGAGGIGNGLVASGNANSTILPVGIGGPSTNF